MIAASLARTTRSHKAEIVQVAYLKLSTLNVNIPVPLHFNLNSNLMINDWLNIR